MSGLITHTQEADVKGENDDRVDTKNTDVNLGRSSLEDSQMEEVGMASTSDEKLMQRDYDSTAHSSSPRTQSESHHSDPHLNFPHFSRLTHHLHLPHLSSLQIPQPPACEERISIDGEHHVQTSLTTQSTPTEGKSPLSSRFGFSLDIALIAQGSL